MDFTLEFHSYIEDKMDHHPDLEEHWDKISQTIQDNRVVDWHKLFHEWGHFYSEIRY